MFCLGNYWFINIFAIFIVDGKKWVKYCIYRITNFYVRINLCSCIIIYTFPSAIISCSVYFLYNIYTNYNYFYIQAVLTISQLTNLAKLALWQTNALSIYNVAAGMIIFETPIKSVLLVTIKPM